MDKKKIKLIIFIIGIILIFCSMIFNELNYLRIIINIIGIILLIVGTVYDDSSKLKLLPVFFFLYLVIAILIDSILVMNFKTIPVYSYNIITSNNSKVYNAIGYRVWDCEGKERKVDRFYRLGYYCDVSNMEAIDSNAFLNNVVDNYDDYKNSYLKITGKISKKEANDYIEMQTYQSNAITLNGYVNFSDSVTLRVIFNTREELLNNYDVYDSITVVGKIWYIKSTENKYVVYMDDSIIVDNNNFNNYEVIITKNNNCQVDKKLLFAGGDYNIYSHCLSNVIVRFDENNIYELSSALSSGKIKLDDLLSKSLDVLINDNDGSNLYIFDKYSIIKCNEYTGSDVIIGDENLSFEDAYCGIQDLDDES